MPDCRVLIIEDEVAIATALEVRLSAMGYQTMAAHDARSGMTAASTFQPDVLILDIRLPDLDGIEVCRRLKEDPDLRSIQVVLLSANINDVSRGEAEDAGAFVCLAKPYEIQDVVAAIEAAASYSTTEA